MLGTCDKGGVLQHEKEADCKNWHPCQGTPKPDTSAERTSRDCTCGARRTKQHNLGCPLRPVKVIVEDGYTCLGGHTWRMDEGVCCPQCNRRASATIRDIGLYETTEPPKPDTSEFTLRAGRMEGHYKGSVQWGSKPDTSAERKAAPLWSGCMNYFPLALLAVARLSKKANDKHNPGEPLHWSREKSNDHLDCAARHLLNPEEIDPEFNEPHAVAHAWRALAVLQLIEEKRLGKTK